MKKRYSLVITYDGANYCGWLVQKKQKKASIQSTIQKALQIALRESPVNLSGASRTDAGVHALGQTAHFETSKDFSIQTLKKSLNALLPKDIKILKVHPVPDQFHARYHATAKRYYYDLHLNDHPSPFHQEHRLFYPFPFHSEKVEQACKMLQGVHDFTSFANEAYKGSAANKPIKNLYRVELVKIPDGVRLIFEGDGFLYKMVRNMVGTLLEVGRERLSPEEIPKILQAKNRKMAGEAAPAKGLFLEKIFYPTEFGFS